MFIVTLMLVLNMVDFLCDECHYSCSVPKFVIDNCEHFCKPLRSFNDLTSSQKKMEKWHKQIRDFKQNLKKASVCECGESNPVLLDFAHFDRNNKSLNFSQSLSIKTLTKELGKGRFQCVWCHRIETASEINNLRCLETPKYGDDYEVRKDSFICGGPLCKGKKRNAEEYSDSELKRNRISKTCKKCTLHNSILRKKAAKAFVIKTKLDIGKCACCEILVDEFTVSCFDFDHIDRSDKSDIISKLSSSGYTLEKIANEIKKCRLLCCKCHRLKTYFELSWPFY